jgi:hypothetical protein
MSAVSRCYDLPADDQRLREALLPESSEAARAQAFDQLRKRYPKRREFSSWRPEGALTWLAEAEKKSLNKALATLGFPEQ